MLRTRGRKIAAPVQHFTSLKEGVGGDESVRHDVHGLGEAKKCRRRWPAAATAAKRVGCNSLNDATSREKNGGTDRNQRYWRSDTSSPRVSLVLERSFEPPARFERSSNQSAGGD